MNEGIYTAADISYHLGFLLGGVTGLTIGLVLGGAIIYWRYGRGKS